MPSRQAQLAMRMGTRAEGFTLIELMVVLLIIAIGTAGVTFAFRDNQDTVLEREAERLSVMLETARVQSRSSGVALAWIPLEQGHAVVQASMLGAARPIEIDPALINRWANSELRARLSNGDGRDASSLLLGSEPMLAPSSVVLSLGQRQLRIATDGLRPFVVQAFSAQELGAQEAKP